MVSKVMGRPCFEGKYMVVVQCKTVLECQILRLTRRPKVFCSKHLLVLHNSLSNFGEHSEY